MRSKFRTTLELPSRQRPRLRCQRARDGVRIFSTCVFVAIATFILGCSGPPLRIDANGNVEANITPVPKLEPVAAQWLPHDKSNPNACLVAVVDVDGLLVNSDSSGLGSWGENPVSSFRERLDAIEKDQRIQAVVLRINSPGGSVTASDIMWRDLSAFKKRTGLPIVACLMDVGTGGGYYLATGADYIVAHPTTVTGAIGCILNVYNLQDLMAQFNILGVPIKAGENIDLGSPIKAIDEEHRRLLQDMADEFHGRFREIVLQSRPEVDRSQKATFDGRVFTARQALELKLIDKIGYLDNAIKLAGSMAGAERTATVFFHRHADRPLSTYSATPNTPLQNTLIPVNVPGLDRSRLPCFLYLWQMEPSTEMMRGK